MRLDFKSLAFGYSLEDGVSTPAWETALGQGAGYKIKDLDTMDELVKGMIYKAVSPSSITFKKGRGGNVVRGDEDRASLVISAVFDKVLVNNIEIPGGKFVLLIVKDDTEHHKGRLKLKYGPDNTYTEGNLVVKNRDLQGLVARELNLAADACWFVYDISIEAQDKLHLSAVIVNRDGTESYANNTALHTAWDALIEADAASKGLCEVASNDERPIEICLSPVSNDLSVEDLGRILTDMYRNAASGDQSNAIRMFGLKYGALILEKGYTANAITRASAINASYNSEVSKGISIYKSIRDSEFGICFSSASQGIPALQATFAPQASGADYNYTSSIKDAVNKIFYGVPGCGKSYHIEYDILGKDKITKKYSGAYRKENIIRTTFYQDYSNTEFVGQILPKIVKGEDGEKDVVEYVFNPGPFTLALIRAISNPGEKVALVIEEINRGNAPAIFGDIFQLLDRDEQGLSEYGIVNVGMLDYLSDYEFEVAGEKKHYKFKEIKIPGNMDIFATMNTSDQNVYTLDTAFTRRWAKERMPNNFGNHPIKDCLVPGMEQYTWKTFVDCINDHIQDRLEDLQINEDKQVGAFFVGEADLLSKGVVLKPDEKQKKIQLFAYKVLEYLWDDVSKLDHSVLFNPAYTTFEKLVKGYIDTGVKIFNNDIFKNAPVVKVDTASVEEAVVESN